MTRLVPTIAYQLARSPALQPHLADTINAAILSDPGIVGADWEDQFKRLVREPCNRVDPGLWKTLPRVVIIDGLDECMDNHESQAPSQGRDAWRRDGQAALLSIIRDAMTSSSHPLPLRFLIFSRPERVISNFFRTNTSSIPNLGQLDMRNLRVEADQDIELYLRHEFPRFPTLHPDAGLDESWPGEEVIEILTRKSDGHFIYVVTAVKYVMENGPSLSLPQDRLQIVLYPKTTAYPDLSTMDQLYYSILLPFSDIWKGVLLRIFQFITPPLEISRYGKYHPLRYLFRRRLADRIHYYPHRYNIESGEPCAPSQWNSKLAIAAYLKLDPRQLSVVLSQLRSVLYVPDNDQDSVTFLHASFSDFLTDKRRSHDFYVPPLGPFKHILWMMWYYSSVTTSIAKNWALHARKKCILAVGIGTETNTDGRTPSEEH
ncbi:hypothetical protein V5O48_008071 [Marasmius crinis-equi]|uniref:Nephrocystin 3-like N-terminal domain-containing protein n=1 Tax=Marasmius crinis-equi TaxID=585013 RepID=A0ABR3FEY6_9AGAR